ncbi:shieldin complex subunit 2 isoform X2 [Notolabrus celidotus]|uniref:shieldin complex subunit 2 isoform X2 n=1 Tax=Notolabrus celidotus TaxID=1203425 RepID=UPI0014900AB7|nr:shieldin complex subunit 2 isoform X2 [Notolabrus celidotus]
MDDQPKILVFLGAPPASSSQAVVSGAGTVEQECPPVTWRHMELTWQDGHLKPLTDPARDHQCSVSVHEYLESCFPAEPTELQKTELQKPEPQKTESGRPLGSKPWSSSAVPPLSTHAQYLSTWTLSQTLILRSRHCSIQSASSPEKTPPPQTPPKHTQTPPSASYSTPELFSPVTSTPETPKELFSQPCPALRAQEGCVIVEVNQEGVLCSQEAEPQVTRASQSSTSRSPEVKKARVSQNMPTEASVAPSESKAMAGRRGATTPLIGCNRKGSRYSVLVAVVHPCHLKEVKVKSGPAAGTVVPLASIVVTDQSAVEMKVVLWRQGAFWVLTVTPGDILLLTGLQVNEDRWRGETVLQTTFSSKLLNLGPITTSTSPPAPQLVDTCSLTSLCGYLRERRPLLVSVKLRPPQDMNRLPYATLRSLRVNTLVHALLRVTNSHLSTAWRSEAESRCRAAVQMKSVLTVEQPGGQQGVLLLWGSAVEWLPRLSKERAAVWDFRVLLVREGLISDLFELHSTPWSSLQPLDPTSQRAKDFLRTPSIQSGDSSIELDLDTLLSQKYSGKVELRVQVITFQFQQAPASQNVPHPVLDSSTSLDGILEALSSDITYTGCGRCAAELDTDANSIYGPCYPCLPCTAVRRYYRPGALTVSGRGSSQVCVQVPPVPLLKILEAPPDRLHRSSAPSSDVKNIRVAAEKIQTLLSMKTFIITVHSHFLCDENSIPISQDFTLMDLQHPV